jgi:hypothetical protein
MIAEAKAFAAGVAPQRAIDRGEDVDNVYDLFATPQTIAEAKAFAAGVAAERASENRYRPGQAAAPCSFRLSARRAARQT